MTSRDILALMADTSRPLVSWLASLIDRLFAVENKTDELAGRIKAIEYAIDELDKRTRGKA